MKTRSAKVYLALIYAVLIAIYLIFFLSFATKPYSAQQLYFIIFIPSLLALNYVINFIELSLKDVDSLISTFVPVFIAEGAYTFLAVLSSIVLAILGLSIKTQIVAEVCLFLVALVIMIASFFFAEHTKSARATYHYKEVNNDVRERFRESLLIMESNGLSGPLLEDLKNLCEEYRHTSPSNNPNAAAAEEEILNEIREMEADDTERAEAHISKLKFLVKRRALLKSN